MEAAMLIRSARQEAGVTQAELGRRLGKSQPTVANLERSGANPTFTTLESALRALGRRLEVVPAATGGGDVDEAQLRAHMDQTPEQRARAHDRAYRNLRDTVGKARRVR